MIHAYIGLGSNLENPVAQLDRAIDALKKHDDLKNLRVSSIYGSKPVGPQDQPDYINAVATFETNLPPIILLDLLQSIEQSQRRVRERHWGPRTLDLDLLLYGQETILLPRLTVPHPFMLERGFVIKPLSDLAPDMLLANGKTVTEQLQQLDTNDLVFIKEE
ncbi:MAG: 2-amino-4-hydroxy-6-hydroxymethyldihydropteridine diphosphokinase [Gammaproteobacteria bacterium]|nr:2-amino-4-hydroxy-6-hydroxymethyldihydropteridine diphosphokinase [Gammaproteobacteria bacterium]PJE55872.1 2-amino-4-hydroxy-6-hydroxymethyldihydropteridine pyrophosphokinase [Marinomonas sp. BSi20584]MBU1466665.1 2-amino-4-hydroxy-6-hydroxymethyldihydropteridine diphosphokinase [Gammaproteobacteria bacterium]MBU2022774.1 2-amino-4-hydroxy-6-hydroxymethyldihydropteridine diphosphokinase [Gammaproteobacteria bacterium]MBU2237124.1 2-amino-4-hydroxy-6-hydroxymethyldihydropteridine diphosphoki